jgi:ParB family transcriptional regulator, chromosome partitioning protein
MSSEGRRNRRKFTVDSLFQDTSARAVGVRDLVDAKAIAIERIQPDPDQPRQSFDEDALEELSESIRREGVLQPIAVRYDEQADQYIIVHGERRWRASQRAGLSEIPAIVRDVPNDRRLVQQLMENVVREDLNAVDRAAALRLLKRQMDDAPWERVAEAVGIRRSRLFQLLGTEKLVHSVQERIKAGTLSEKQTRPLQGLTPEAQETLATMIEDGLAERQAQQISRQLRQDDRYVQMDPAELSTVIQSMGTASSPSKDDPDRQADAGSVLTKALADVAASTDAELPRRIEQLGIDLGRIATEGGGQSIDQRQLRALKRLIDLAIDASR